MSLIWCIIKYIIGQTWKCKSTSIEANTDSNGKLFIKKMLSLLKVNGIWLYASNGNKKIWMISNKYSIKSWLKLCYIIEFLKLMLFAFKIT